MTEPRVWIHDELADDLAAHLVAAGDRVAWTNIPVGMAGSCRPDVLTMDKSFTRPRFTTYEIKVSRSDFQADVRAGKWLNYFEFSEAVYFAAPAGLLTRADIPADAGLYLRGENGWRAARAPRRRAVDRLDETFIQKLLIDGIERAGRFHIDRSRRDAEKAWRNLAAARLRLGEEFARYMADVSASEARLEELREACKRENERIAETEERRHRLSAEFQRAAVAGALEALGLTPGDVGLVNSGGTFAGYTLRCAVADRLRLIDSNDARRRAADQLQRAREQLARIEGELRPTAVDGANAET